MANPSSLAKEAKESVSKSRSKLVQDVIRERDSTFSRPTGAVKKKDDPVDSLIRVAAAGIGFFSEASHYRQEKKKEKKQKAQESMNKVEKFHETYTRQINEAVWELDETEQEAASRVPDAESTKEPDDLAEAFLGRHPYQGTQNLETKLALPVILVQRRPKKRARGFVRAYAPVLGDVGIDQATFLDFIDTFNKALEPNPWLFAINLAGLAGMAAPDPFSMLIGTGTEVATDIIMELQSRVRSNKFLDRINSEFFAPRGLMCLVATWKPSACDDEIITAADFEGGLVEPESTKRDTPTKTSLAERVKSSEETLQRTRERINEMVKPSSGAFGCTAPAPLMFPSLSDTTAMTLQDSKGKKRNAIDRTEAWVNEYSDKQAQAKWIEKNREPSMTNLLPKPTFRSRYADPNHPASSGDIVAFLTGGRWRYGHPKVTDAENSSQMPDSKTDGDVEPPKSEDRKGKAPSSEGRHGGKSASQSMNLLQSDVLYLVILSLPSRSE